jgi:hypothetical protein
MVVMTGSGDGGIPSKSGFLEENLRLLTKFWRKPKQFSTTWFHLMIRPLNSFFLIKKIANTRIQLLMRPLLKWMISLRILMLKRVKRPLRLRLLIFSHLLLLPKRLIQNS